MNKSEMIKEMKERTRESFVAIFKNIKPGKYTLDELLAKDITEFMTKRSLSAYLTYATDMGETTTIGRYDEYVNLLEVSNYINKGIKRIGDIEVIKTYANVENPADQIHFTKFVKVYEIK